MRRFLDSMATRVFAILVIGVVVAALFTTWLADNERDRTFAQMHDYRVAERVEQLVRLMDAATPEARAKILVAANSLGMRVDLASPPDSAARQENNLVAVLRDRLGVDRDISATANDPSCARDPRLPMGDPRSSLGDGRLPPPGPCDAVYIKLRDGQPLRLVLIGPRDFPHRPPRPYPGYYLVLFLFIIAGLAYIVARMTVRPLKQLADAAAQLGDNIERPSLAEEGPTEIRQAVAAFNAMQSRIRRHVEQRTHILAAVTHDLQTPLTRLRLRLEKVSDTELRDRLIGDLTVMQNMVREGLELARSMDSAEPMQPLDLDSLLDSVCSDAVDAGQEVRLSGQTGISVMALPGALRRCFINLIDNAVKYGRFAQVSANREAGNVVVRIRDGGQGIPEGRLESVFDPFFRLETSRSRETGGTGLGLTIARNIVELHGGRIRLRNHISGGLEALVELPCRP